jgi:hypothetical protein
MAFVFKWEVGNAPNGGYTDHPLDPGGETKWGISKRANPDVDIKNLTKAGAIDIYKQKYWKEDWDKLPFPLAACCMDTSVNMGPVRAQKLLELSEGDYVKYLQLRIARYKEIIKNNPSQKVWEKGWMNRMTDLRRFIDEHKEDSGTSNNA